MMMYELDDIERASLKGERPEEAVAGCVECGEPLPYRGHVATPVCDACLEKTVPPFPQEPPFNSQEAVAQAAETIGGKPPLALCVECGEPLPQGGQPLGPFGTPVCARCAVAAPNPPSGVGTAEDQSVGAAAEVLRDDADMRDALEAMDEEADAELLSALHSEVERLQAIRRELAGGLHDAVEEVEQLREENAAQAVDLQRIGALYTEMRGEVERLRAELAQSRERHAADARDLDQIRVTVRDESLRAHQAEEQRDALADALLLNRDPRGHLDACPAGKPGGDMCSKLCKASLAALQKAGRL